MTWWDLKNGKRLSGDIIDYCAFRIAELVKRKGLINDEFYNEMRNFYINKIKEELTDESKTD